MQIKPLFECQHVWQLPLGGVFCNEFTAIDCGPLTDPTNGQVNTPSGITFGSVATFSCSTGYRLSHQQVVMCGADGMWSPASPSCLGKCKKIYFYDSIMCYVIACC